MPIFYSTWCSLSSWVAKDLFVSFEHLTTRPFYSHVWWESSKKEVLWQHGHHERMGGWEIVEAERDIYTGTHFCIPLSLLQVHCHLVCRGMLDLGTLIMIVFLCWRKMVFMVCLPFQGSWSKVMHVTLINIESNLFMIPTREHVDIYSWYTLICLAPCLLHMILVINIS